MKLFTRSLSLLSMLLVASVSFAQLDIAVTDIYVSSTPSNTVPENFESSIYFTVENVGAEIFPADTIITGIRVNLNEIHGPVNLTISPSFPNGQAANLPFAYEQLAYYTFDGLAPSYEVCAYAFVKVGEVDSSDNVLCTTITVNPAANNDWEATSAAIIQPDSIDGWDINSNPNIPPNPVPDIDTAEVVFTNRGNITYTPYTELEVGISLNGDTNYFNGISGATKAPGDDMTFRIGDPTFLPENTVVDSGTYYLCGIANVLGDEVDSNDVTCAPFTIVDSYNPFAPGNWPSGREEVSNNMMKIVPKYNEVALEGINNPTQVTITDAQGRMVQSANINSDATLQMAKEAAGVYIIQAQDSKTGAIERKKVSIQ